MAAALLLCVSQVSVTALAADTVYVDCDVLRCRSTAEINDTNIVTNQNHGPLALGTHALQLLPVVEVGHNIGCLLYTSRCV